MYGEPISCCKRSPTAAGMAAPPPLTLHQRRQVILIELRIGEEVDHHGRDRGPRHQLVALDQLGREVAIPTAHQHDGAAIKHRRIHAALHAGHMEERQHHQLTGIGTAAEPERIGEHGVHHIAMAEHAALRPAGGAGAVRNHAQIIGPGGQQPRRALRRQRVDPQSHIRSAMGCLGALTTSGMRRSVVGLM